MVMENFDEVIYGDKSVHKVIRRAFVDSWEKALKLYNLKFVVRRLANTHY